jgi:uncharacterized protein YxjI
MNMSQGAVHIPPGLEYLSMINQLLIHQKSEYLEAFTGIETRNKYHIKNNLGQHIYYAREESDWFTRNYCGPTRPFHLRIFDSHKHEVIHLYRPLAGDNYNYSCSVQRIEVTLPPGHLVGTVEQDWSFHSQGFSVKNANGEFVLRIQGPCSGVSGWGDVNFDIISVDGSAKLGSITKQWSGFAREAFTDADDFRINFPMDLDVQIKAVVLGACFLIVSNSI